VFHVYTVFTRETGKKDEHKKRSFIQYSLSTRFASL